VVLYHSADIFSEHGYVPGVARWEQVFQFGHAGVEIFFVLSGFIICHVHFRDSSSRAAAQRYFRKRVTRIYPPVACVVAFTLLGRFAAGFPVTWPTALTSVTLIPLSADASYSPSALWTLTFEMYFYFVFLLSYLSKRLFLVTMSLWAGLSLFAPLESTMGTLTPAFLQVFISPYGLLFGIGVLVFLSHNTTDRPSIWLGAGVAFFAAVATIDVMKRLFEADLSALLTFAYGASAGLIVRGASSSCLNGDQGAWNRSMTVLGEASFAIYLWHEPIQRGIVRLLLRFGLFDPHYRAPIFVLLCVSGVVSGVAVWHFIERPMTKLIRQYF
jgi:peptidoglycan/LPS O-acetylase OafA/YrhL